MNQPGGHIDQKTSNFIKEKLKNLPTSSGVYLMKDSTDTIIYVGKAKNLKNRVSSYFISKDKKDIKTKVLVSFIKDFEIILTNSESEAFLLERNLIKLHNPKYNILLKDGKEYPYLRINFKESWPRIEKVRKKTDSAFYIGPFSNEGQLKLILKVASEIFQTIKCSRQEFQRRKRVCSYYDMNMCLGPCCMEVDKKLYLDVVNNAVSFLMGRNKQVKETIRQTMLDYSQKQEYLLAAKYRDQLQALEQYESKQYVVVGIAEADVIYCYKEDDLCSVEVLQIRDEKLLGQESFFFTSFQDRKNILEEFLVQYYESRPLPRTLILEEKLENIDTILDFIQSGFNHDIKTTVRYPSRGETKKLMEIASKNASYNLHEEQRTLYHKKTSLVKLQERFKLINFPHRIECIDISHLQGTNTVASCVCFIDAVSDKNLYRSYIIKDLKEHEIDDFKSMREVVRRRIIRGEREDTIPDLILIDGGKQQLSCAIQGMEEAYSFLKEEDSSFTPSKKVDIISIAKERGEGTYERIFLPGRERSIPLEEASFDYKLFTQLRDEAHRFAITAQRKKRNKVFHHSDLSSIPGVGEKTAKKLLTSFEGIDQLKEATIEDIIDRGFSRNVAEAVAAWFQKEDLNIDLDTDTDDKT